MDKMQVEATSILRQANSISIPSELIIFPVGKLVLHLIQNTQRKQYPGSTSFMRDNM